jgi:hypothetical protein
MQSSRLQANLSIHKTQYNFLLAFGYTNIYLVVFHFPFEASKGNKNALIFDVPSHPPANLKKISPCRCLRFASWLCPFHIAKPKRLLKPKLEIFLHSTAKIGLRDQITLHLK